ncbi:Non-specific serine/threonine protein kinase [Bertholletia excelsa]
MIPYYTARLSRSNFSYQFDLSSSGPIFIRLHFFPTSYQDFDPYKAFFSVKVNQFTFLNNFSAYAFAAFLQKETVIREFSINVGEDKWVNITFATSHTPPDAYAFVNGIEIISMPMDLYYRSDDANALNVIGTDNPYYLENDTALEMVHRLNVGGGDVSPMEDTGMYRQWLKDNDYISTIGAAAFDGSVKPRFGMIPNYTAPDTGYNLTWNSPIDPGFSYMVRLHFCEIVYFINKTGDRVFQIYMANQTAEADFDVIARTGNNGNGIPIYRDYTVTIIGGTAKKQNLSLALHPVSTSRTRWSDAILNGVEVFKMSDNYHNLAGPKPDLHPPLSPTQPSSSKRKKTKIVIVICCGVISGVVALSVLGFFMFQRQARARFGAIKPNKAEAPWLPSTVCRRFSLAEIRSLTNNIDDALIIGHGGFGNVYKGFINGGATPVAIKRLKPGSQQGFHEFLTEIETLSQLRYLHLGLQYLHASAERMVFHRDVKTTNILLDDKWGDKVSDFGSSKMNPNEMSNTHISTTLIEKSDGYSFEVVLIEVLCGRPAINKSWNNDQVSLAVWGRKAYKEGTLEQIIDPRLKSNIGPECLEKFGEIAMSCLHDEGIKRHLMSDVVWSLEFALQLQESEKDRNELVGTQIEVKDMDADPLLKEDKENLSDGGTRVKQWANYNEQEHDEFQRE